MREIKIGDAFQARTHAEFLNKLLGLNYRQYMRSGYSLASMSEASRFYITDNTGMWTKDCCKESLIWMVRADENNRNGWSNKWDDEGDNKRFTEVYSGIEAVKAHWAKYRIIFEIKEDDASKRNYVFRGIFKIIDGCETTTIDRRKGRTHERISDSITIKKQDGGNNYGGSAYKTK